MVAKREPKTELSYEEQVAIARANLDRHEAEHRDPAAALDKFVRETFDQESLLAVWQQWRRERGKPDLE